MRNIRTSLLVGVAAVAIAGLSGMASAQSADTHVMTVQLPGGGTEEIRYTGNTPPQLVFTTGPASLAGFDPMPSLFGFEPPFAMMERISAEMDRQAAAMFARADNLTAQVPSNPTQLTEAGLRGLPPGSASYSFVSTMSGNGVCTKSVEITSTGNGAAPRVVSRSSGDCGPQAGATGPVNLPVARPPGNNRPDLLLTKANEPKLYVTAVRQVADAQR
jgi:hypothetical protein